MDPNVALAILRRLVQVYPGDGFDAQDLVEAADALDQWLSKGGFLPRDWNKNR
jgi:hypothetical protein